MSMNDNNKYLTRKTNDYEKLQITNLFDPVQEELRPEENL